MNSKQQPMTLGQRILSSHRGKRHYVIYLLGVKISLRSYRLMYYREAEEKEKIKEKLIMTKEKAEKYLAAIKSDPRMYEQYVRIPNDRERDEKWTPVIRQRIEERMSQTPFPLFYLVEIETLNRCNGECDFCPCNRFDDPRELCRMTPELFNSIMNQLAELDYTGRVALYSNNEPLLDPRIFEFAAQARRALPKAHVYLFTNGTLLTLEKFVRLIPNLDTLVIDVYYSGEEGLPENIRPIAEYCTEHEELQTKVKIQLIDRHAIRNNRGGKSKNRCETHHFACPCDFPFIQLVIRPDGKVSLCCNDGTGEYTMGDLKSERIVDVWRGEKFQRIREAGRNTRRATGKCLNCDACGSSGESNSSPDYVFKKSSFVKSWTRIKALLH